MQNCISFEVINMHSVTLSLGTFYHFSFPCLKTNGFILISLILIFCIKVPNICFFGDLRHPIVSPFEDKAGFFLLFHFSYFFSKVSNHG